MSSLKKLMIILLICSLQLVSGCWNYREVNDVNIVTGLAIDYDSKAKQYILSSEIIDFSVEGGHGEVISIRGKTLFDAIRNMISKSGKKLYFGHAKVFIISEEVAEKGLVPIMDLIYRDAELRSDMWLLVSDETAASDLLNVAITELETVNSFHLEKNMKSQKYLSKTYTILQWRLVQDIYAEGISPAIPLVRLSKRDGKLGTEVKGTAVFRGDKMVGVLDENETKLFLILKKLNQLGLWIIEPKIMEEQYKVTLEMFNCDTNISVVPTDIGPKILVDIQSHTGIAEVGGTVDILEENAFKQLEKQSEMQIKQDTEDFIKRVQTEYKSDIFGFGKLIKKRMPKYWKEHKGDWNELFSSLPVEVTVDIIIRSSSLTYKPIKISR